MWSRVLERRVRLELSGIVRIRRVEQVLDTEQNLYRQESRQEVFH